MIICLEQKNIVSPDRGYLLTFEHTLILTLMHALLGFIKIALREGVDIIPVYLFGNTSVLSVLKTGFLANMSRKMQMSVTYTWGKWFLPIPRGDKLVYVRGKPLGLPHIPEPTDEDINKWHGKYVEEVQRLYYENREKLPAYKNKKLFID